MGKKIRLIARLDVKDANLVKGIQLEGLRKLGDPNGLRENITSRASTSCCTSTSWPACTTATISRTSCAHLR